MGESWFRRELLTPRRLVFNVLFYGLHLFFFAYGWYSQVRRSGPRESSVADRCTGDKQEARSAQRSQVVRMDFSWCRLGPRLRRRVNLAPYASQCHSSHPPTACLAFPCGREHLVPQASRLLHGILGHGAYHRTLRQLLQRRKNSCVSRCMWWYVVSHLVQTEVRPEIALDIHYTQAGGITGHFMLLIMVLMYTTAHHKIRAQCFEAFWYTHHLAFFFMIGLYSHATGCFVRDSADPDYIPTFPFYSTEHCLGYESWRFIIWPGIIYFGERVWREIRARRATRLSKVLVHPSGTPIPFNELFLV